MRSTGQLGFEGLIATLFTCLTGSRFYVARSGDQPADAASSAADVAIQVKRYKETTFSETQFEGEFHKACRLYPNLDSYIFAASRPTAQLITLAEQLQQREGIDIFLIGFDKPDSPLPTLCLRFWQSERSVFLKSVIKSCRSPCRRRKHRNKSRSVQRFLPRNYSTKRQMSLRLPSERFGKLVSLQDEAIEGTSQ